MVRTMNAKLILIIAVVCLAVLFVVQNVSAVTVSIFLWKVSLSLALLIFITAALGFVAGWFLHSLIVYRKNKKELADIRSEFQK
jgi:uncharacterized integral membrane protein